MDLNVVSKDKFKQHFANIIADAFQKCYPEKYEEIGHYQVFDPDFIYDNLEKPKDPKMGRFALPVFRFARLLSDKPQEIASKVAQAVDEGIAGNKKLVTVTAAGGFLNAKVDFNTLTMETLQDVLDKGKRYGTSTVGEGRTVLVEYSSVNIAKPFGIAHLRTTILGASLREIFKKLGYNVVGLNYLGDWGTQFGKLIVAYLKWGADISKDDPCLIDKLFELYVRFHAEAKQDELLDEKARVVFKKLENGDTDTTKLWKLFRSRSIEKFKRIYDRLGVEFDLIIGESDLNDKIEPIIERLEKAGLSRISEGALVVDLEDTQLPPCLLKKADGATLYATRDIVGAFWRFEKYQYDQSLYVVANSQSDHFKQVFGVISRLEETEHTPEDERLAPRLKHVDFGWVKFGDKTMSTRSGNVIPVEDVVNKAVSLVKQMIIEKNPNLKAIDKTAHMVGVGAVKFSQLSVKRLTDVNFDWDAVLSFEGETGPYLQYTHARLCSLERNYDKDIKSDIEVTLLAGEEEQRIVELLADFPEAIADAVRNYDPYFIATYLLRLAGAFNKFYQRKTPDGRIDKIISDDVTLTSARMALVTSVRTVIGEGLHLLGIQAPEEM
ncbi:MAG: arginine--tRNA ligase [Candidatus Zixiibacteriota bacterium]|nr:MAG: arginine--tRNA ligase [candidate division Zixibacteria bacterium]